MVANIEEIHSSCLQKKSVIDNPMHAHPSMAHMIHGQCLLVRVQQNDWISCLRRSLDFPLHVLIGVGVVCVDFNVVLQDVAVVFVLPR